MKQLRRCISSSLLFCLASSTMQAQEIDTLLTPYQLDSMHSHNVDYWGSITPGRGFEVVKTEYGTLNISGYMLFRYINQLPAEQTYYDHFGNPHLTDGRNDMIWHRVQAFLTGWIYAPKLNYNITFWTVNATNQVAIAGNMSYRFSKLFNLSAGINSLSGTRSLQGSHPYWLGSDRVMADEYFRTGFTSAIWATGEPLNTVHYFVTLGQNLSQLGISAARFNRALGYGASLYWLPTTDELAPEGHMAIGNITRSWPHVSAPRLRTTAKTDIAI